MAPSLAQSETIALEAATARVAPPTLNSRIGLPRTTPWPVRGSSHLTNLPRVPRSLRCHAWSCGCLSVLLWVAQWYRQVQSVTQTTGGKHVQQEDDSLLGLSQLGSLSRMAPQPRMMSDLCSSHQSVTTLTVQQLYNCGFSISVLTGTKSPHVSLILIIFIFHFFICVSFFNIFSFSSF